ncbi:hypothetical protein M231_04883 [Tremella mesenterica]|uniref:Enoyl reductase (ER) domain-containing protein n=1 Tax=Tremella mesenterica TaxID=5217 RepID=A0A4Q1BJK1_TREME|nr:hypothetical protein M231_04883 [Tremella mesenterica]
MSIPTTMRAAKVGVDKHYYDLVTLPVPQPKGYECLLKIGAAGFCHTDTMVLEGVFGGNKVIGSHEPSGTVVALGEDAERDERVKLGQRVAGMLKRDVCFECSDCKLVDWIYCQKGLNSGLDIDGFFSEYAIVDSRFCATLPDNMSFEQAAPLTCAGLTIYKAIKVAVEKKGILPGKGILAISGLGALGHLGTQMAKAMGYTTIGIDARPGPISLANEMKHKPDLTIDASKVNVEKAKEMINDLRPKGYFGWEGVDAIIMCADAVASQRYAINLLVPHGLMVIVAQPPTYTFEFRDFIFKDISVIASMHGNEIQLQECVDLCAKEGIRTETTTFTLDQHKEMCDAIHQDGWKGKAVMVFE